MALLRQNYIRGKKIGQGAHGSVYEAILVSETKTDDKRRPLVLKQAVGEKHSNELRHECEMLKLIEGKCAPEFVDAAFQGEEGEMVMTLAGEQTLKKYFNNHVDGEKQQIVLKQVACEVMDGLEEIHKKGACHRDLKPDNIMITSESGVIVDLKLVDFGEATNNMKNPGEDSFGAVAFRIPDSEEKTAAEIDLYSLGMTLRALSAGNSDDWNMDPFDAYSERNNYLNREDKNQKSTFESFTQYLTCEPGITIEMARSHPWLQNQSQPRSQS